MLLNYKIDTTGRQSGSPVLVFGENNAVGVYVASGYPNISSVIRKVGNVFSEYLVALKVKARGTSSNATTLSTAMNSSFLAPRFVLISIKAKAKESARLSSMLSESAPLTVLAEPTSNLDGDADSDVRDTSRSSDDANELALVNRTIDPNKSSKILSGIFGGKPETNGIGRLPSTRGSRGARNARVLKGLVILFPERLVLNETDSAAPLLLVLDYKVVVDKAISSDDVKTVLFVNFPKDGLDAVGKKA